MLYFVDFPFPSNIIKFLEINFDNSLFKVAKLFKVFVPSKISFDELLVVRS